MCTLLVASFGRPLQVTVRPMLLDRCLCLSVTLVYCGETVGWIKMPFGIEVGVCLGDIVLYGSPAPHRKGHSSRLTFRPMSVVAKLSPISATADMLYLLFTRMCLSGILNKKFTNFSCYVVCISFGSLSSLLLNFVRKKLHSVTISVKGHCKL